MRNPEFGKWKPKCGMRNLKNVFRNAESKIWNAVFGKWEPEFRKWSLGCVTRNSACGIQNSESEFPKVESEKFRNRPPKLNLKTDFQNSKRWTQSEGHFFGKLMYLV